MTILADFVYPDVKAARSVNLERDKGHGPSLLNYQLTAKGSEIISRLISGLTGEKVSAWSLTGPYGMGKSAFANFLLALMGPVSSDDTLLARKKLMEFDKTLFDSLMRSLDNKSRKRGFFRIPITSSYEPINRSLISGMLRALDTNRVSAHEKEALKSIRDQMEVSLKEEFFDSRVIIHNLSSLQQIVKRPILLIIDEFGKNLEYMAHHPDKGDIFIMQLIAETTGIFLIVCLHQSFEGYAVGLTAQQRQEWNKVQGRFEDISFTESTTQMLALASRVLVQRKNNSLKNSIKAWAKEFLLKAKQENIPRILDLAEDEIVSLYPLHPIAAIILPELCRRFAQNDRTLFSFLCSGDPHALPEYLQHQNLNGALPFLGLDYLYDYFFSASITAYANRPEVQRWVEIHDIIGQAHDLSPTKQTILKTVGVLNLIASSNGIKATPSILKLSLLGSVGLDERALDAEIAELSKQKVLIYRSYAQEYRLWEGSDFDIPGAVIKKRDVLALRPLDEILQNYSPHSPIIASRHSYKTGTTRKFECRWMSISALAENQTLEPLDGHDGLLVYSFGNQKNIQNLPEVCANGCPLLIAYAPHENQIKELALEAAAIKAVLLESPELERDGVAKKEARFRLQAAEDHLREYIDQIYSPTSLDVTWYVGSEIKQITSYRALSTIISDVCDRAYASCPPIRNEMINSNYLSASAARARRELAEAMVEHEEEEQLGLKGFGPEVAVYRSLFKLVGLHINIGGKWKFVKPDKQKSPELVALWQLLDEILIDSENSTTGVSVGSLVERLKQTPFGMREGPITLYLCHYLIVNSDDIALYQEGAYKPYFGSAEIALMIKRPELFSVKYYSNTGLGREVVQAYMQVLNTDAIYLKEGVRNTTLLQIVTPLIQFMEGLPEYSRFTRSISLPAQRLRGVVLNAREPIKLLFEEIPEALGIEPVLNGQSPSSVWKTLLRDKLQEALVELGSASKVLDQKIQKALMEAFKKDCKGDGQLDSLRANLKIRVAPIKKHCADPELRAILGSIASEVGDNNHWVRGIAGRVVKKPVDSWRDGDFEPYQAALFEIADRIASLSSLVGSGLGIHGSKSVVLSVTRPDGRVSRRVVHYDDDSRSVLKTNYKPILEAPKETRELLCALLTESLEEDFDE